MMQEMKHWQTNFSLFVLKKMVAEKCETELIKTVMEPPVTIK